ncbi:hypothetical protein ACOMHN_027818 [Nucella lapillus]
MADASEQEAPPAAATQSAIDVGAFSDYLRKVVPLLLDDEDPDLKAFKTAISDKQNIEGIKKFINDPQTPTLLFQRVGGKDESEETPEGEGDGSFAYHVAPEVHFSSAKMISIVFIKRGPVVEADKAVSSQVRVMNFSDGSPYETLHAYVSNAVAPYFKS